MSTARRSIRAAREIVRTKGLTQLVTTTGLFMADLFSDKIPSVGRARAEIAITRLNLLKIQSPDLDYQIRCAFNFAAAGAVIRPLQVPSEVTRLVGLVRDLDPKTVLEIGTDGGGTLFLFATTADENALILSIDLQGYAAWRIPLYLSFARDHQKLSLMRCDSHAASTLREIGKVLKERKVDFLFIDGDHSYEGVRMDFEMYSPWVRKGGLVAFHDIVVHDPRTGCEVNKFWNEIKGSYKYEELVENRDQGWGGIGVLHL